VRGRGRRIKPESGGKTGNKKTAGQESFGGFYYNARWLAHVWKIMIQHNISSAVLPADKKKLRQSKIKETGGRPKQSHKRRLQAFDQRFSAFNPQE